MAIKSSSLLGGEFTPRMPKLSSNSTDIKLKQGDNQIIASSAEAFFTTMGSEMRSQAGAVFTLEDNADRQTLINIVSGVSGTLTHIVGGAAKSSNTVSIFVTTGGKETEYKLYNLKSYHRPVLGGALPIEPQLIAATVGTSMLGSADDGWESDTAAAVGIIAPSQCIFQGIGIPFTDNLKVEIQYSVGVRLGGVDEIGAVTYVRD